MAEYITKDAVISLFEKWSDGYPYIEIPVQDAIKQVSAIPPADVRPVVRGKWLKSPECPEEYDICSVCRLNDKHRSRGNAEHPALESVAPFCKWCGADMRGGDADGEEKD